MNAIPNAAPDRSQPDMFPADLGQLRLMAEAATDLIVSATREGMLRYLSPNAKKVLGYDPAELVGTNLFDHAHPEDLELLRTRFEQPAAPGTCRWRHKDGSWHWLEIAGPDFDAEGAESAGLLVIHDVTERRRLEAELGQAAKLCTLGLLAGGVVHDFNNILTGIMAHTQLAGINLDLNRQEASDSLDEIRRAAERAKALVQQILNVGRMRPLESSSVDLKPLAEEILGLLRPTLAASIALEAQIDPGTPPVWAHSGQIYQVLINLCANAAQAMRHRAGRIEVKLDPWTVEPGAEGKLPPGNYARISVADSGPGMTQEVLHRIFEPWFTTKPAGEGTGFGLTLVQRIVAECGGAIEVTSRPGLGTVARVFLPAVEAAGPEKK